MPPLSNCLTIPHGFEDDDQTINIRHQRQQPKQPQEMVIHASAGTTTISNRKPQRSVSFHRYIEIREHPRVLGDHPSVTSGPPISLGWYDPNACTTIRMPLDDYETMRRNKRIKLGHSFYLPIRLRNRILLEDAGVSIKEIQNVQLEIVKIKAGRAITNFLLQYEIFFLIIEEITRFLYRLLNINTKHGYYCLDSEVRRLLDQCERAATLNGTACTVHGSTNDINTAIAKNTMQSNNMYIS